MRLVLPLPPSANAVWRSIARQRSNGKAFVTVVLSKEGRQFKRDAASWLNAQRTEVLEGPVSIRMTVFFPNRRGDLDNRTKPTLDVLQGVAYTNDSQIVHIESRREIAKDDPRVVVIVEPYQADLFTAPTDSFHREF